MKFTLLPIQIGKVEFIAWRLKEIFSDYDSIYRVSFNEITNSAVQEAIKFHVKSIWI